MRKHGFLWLAGMVLLIIGGCAAGQTNGISTGAVGMNEAELVRRIGQPQKIIARPGGGKILVYEKHALDQMAVMGGGAWRKTEQMYYWLDAQGKVDKVKYYPYGKRRFIFPSEQEREDFQPTPKKLAQAKAASPPPAPAKVSAVSPPSAAPVPQKSEPIGSKPPEAVASPRGAQAKAALPPPAPAKVSAASPPSAAPVPQKSEPIGSKPPAAVASPRGMREAARLELRMSKEDVVHLLGLPDRTEGFWAEGKQVLIWVYRLGDSAGRQILTPLVFENGRLSGWGDTYYHMILRKVRSQTH